MSNEKKYPVHHTDHENFPDVGAVYVTKAEFDAMKSERDALQKLVEEKQRLLDEATDKLLASDKQIENLMNSASRLLVSQDKVNDKLADELAELKEAQRWIQASMYAESVDAGMENRRLKRALWLARAERAKEMCQRLLIQGFDPKWEEVERKCRAKAEQYK